MSTKSGGALACLVIWFGVALALPVIALCETADSLETIPPVFAIRDDTKLSLILSGRDSVLYDSGKRLEAPSLSPDGRFLSAYVPSHSGSQLLGLVPGHKLFSGSIETDLVLFDRYTRTRVEFDEVKVRRVMRSPRMIIYADFLPPVWLDDCQRFYMPSRDGVDLAHVDGTTDSILYAEKLTAMSRVPQSTRCAVSTERSVFVIDTLASLTQTLIDSSKAKSELGGRIRGLAYSRDGRSLAIGHDRTVSVLDLHTGEIRDYGKAPRDIYWLSWLQGDTGLIVLSGTEDRETSFRNAAKPTGVVDGGFLLCVLTDNDSKSRKLYDQVSYDVRRVNPALSGDGRSVVFTSRSKMERGTLMVLPLDGRKAFRLNKHYLYRSPVWAAWTE